MTKPRNYRNEAASLRSAAARLEGEAKTVLMKIAALYDRLADAVGNRPMEPDARAADEIGLGDAVAPDVPP